ncbi:phosphotransferase [Candidatus Poribacteria bacterium]|nr:phosphotransferase [Candidatus Poribacteria bacterium]
MPSYFSTSLQKSLRQDYSLNISVATPIGTGAMSHTMELITNQGRLFLKCYKPAPHQDSDLQRIAFTHAVQCFLRRGDFPVPRLIPNKAGKTYTISGHQIYAVSEFVEGYDYGEVNAMEGLRYAGRTLGIFHQQLYRFQECYGLDAPKPTQPQWEPMAREIFGELRDRFTRVKCLVRDDENSPISQYQIDQWLQELEGLEEQLSVDVTPQWIIHGDYRAQNLRFGSNNCIRAVLDLDTARPADRAFDLGYALIFFPAVYQDTPLTPREKSIFLRAYETICPLSEAERQGLVPHLRLAFLRGMTLWLHLYHFGGMSKRIRPWLRGYLKHAKTISAF